MTRPPENPDAPKIETASISRLSTFSSCATKYEIRYLRKLYSETEAHYFFTGKTIHEGIEAYYKGESPSVYEGTMTALATKLKGFGMSDYQVRSAMEIGALDEAILLKFSSGEIKKPDGSLYASPKASKAYKEIAKEMGLYKRQMALKSAPIGNMAPPKGGISEVVGRIVMLAKRYQETLLIPREAFEEIHLEERFDLDVILPSGTPFRFMGFMDCWGALKPEYRDRYSKGKKWVLIDYKTGRAKDDADHAQASDESLQLTLYHKAILDKGIPVDDFYVALHYVDAAYAAATPRTVDDFKILPMLADSYVGAKSLPVLPKRLLYADNDDCSRCELRGHCERIYGFATTIAAQKAAAKRKDM